MPILKQLAQGGWTPDAPLEEEVQPLPGVHAAGHPIRCYQVRFTSHLWHGQPVRIFGFYAAPADSAGMVPALLLVHGGGGWGTLGRVVEAAGHGFAALSIDLPGKGTNRENQSRSTGPDMTVPQIFATTPAVSDCYLYHAVLAQRRAITFLCRRPEVDPDRIGLVGASWGGATGLITTALDARVKCLVDIYGSGYVRGGSCWQGYFERRLSPARFDVWEANYDASRYLADIHVPVLGITGTADGCYWLPQFQQTMRGIHPARACSACRTWITGLTPPPAPPSSAGSRRISWPVHPRCPLRPAACASPTPRAATTSPCAPVPPPGASPSPASPPRRVPG